MPVIVLLRHGLSTANTAGILAGRAPGVSLTDRGVSALESTLRMLPHRGFSRLLHSPLQRCEQTARLAASHAEFAAIEADEDIIELDYGQWTGRSLRDLASEPEWKTVLEHASQAQFPGGESIAEAADRAVGRVRSVVEVLRAEEAARRVEAEAAAVTAGSEPPAKADIRQWAMLVSHGDIIKAIIADALGMPLDDFQRIAVAPGSFTVIDYSGPHPVLSAMSVTAAGLAESGTPGGGGLR